ncbi:MAG: hypothetical protein J5884_04815 [Paludibacteraceae bacterium]|nr:hypothetical protein [Paludibacteraceae bacterium]
MALSLSTSIATALFTCDVPNMVITTDRPSVDVALKVRSVTIFSTTYYASSGKVTVRDLSSVLESYFINQNISIASVDFEFQDGEVSDHVSFEAIYCRLRCIGLSAEDFYLNHFLTTSTNRLTTIDCPEYLSCYLTRGLHGGTVTAMVQLPNGSVTTYSYYKNIRALTDRVVSFLIAPADVQAKISTDMNMEVKLLQFTYTLEQRTCRFFIQRVPAARRFFFWNVFNCKEAVAFPAETIKQLETDFSETVIEHRFAQYDVEHTRTFQTQTGDLLSLQTQWLEQFLTSPKIQLAWGNNPTVLIIEYEHEISDAPGKANAINFKWKLSDQRITLEELTETSGIFTEHYTEEYA